MVVTDKPSKENKDPNILLGGVLTPPVAYPGSTTECLPECRPSRNELCIKQEGLMKCVCRPGFARMFPDQPCKRKLQEKSYFFGMIIVVIFF